MSLLRQCRLPVLTFLTLAVVLPAFAQSAPEAPLSTGSSKDSAAKRLASVDDVNSVRTVSGLQISPDGDWLSYAVKSADVAKDKAFTNLWMSSWDGKQQLKLTSSGDVLGSARWSPDGRYLGFLTKRGDEAEKNKGVQLWLLDRQGGEAQKLSDIKGGVADFAWSPDGKRVLLAVSDFDNSEEPEQMEGWKRKTKPPVVIDRYHFKQDREGYLSALQTHLQVLDVSSGKVAVLTSGKYSESGAAWSPDGKQIAFFSNRAGKPDATEETTLYAMEAQEGAVPRALVTTVTEEGAAPAWSPDGNWIAYLSGDALKYSAYHRFKLSLVPSAGGAAHVLAAKLDRRVEAPLNWSADGSQLYFIVEDDRASYAARLSLKDETLERLSSGRRLVQGLVLGKGGKLAALAADAKHPFEAHALEGGALRAVSHQNDSWLEQVTLGSTEDFTSTSADGAKVNGLLSKPPGFVAGRHYPTLLYIHGGPNGQDGYRYDPVREALTANGYVVMQVNYRGSSGRGDAFQKAIFADWGNKEVKDLLGAVDWAVAQGIADPNRLGLGGWSYGGLLTDYTIASDTRFKAAVSGAGSGNQISMYGSDQYIVQYEQEVGAPWKKLDVWIKLSYPFFKADRIKTPTLFLSGEKDFNVPTAGAEQMYQALQSLGVPTQLVIYPGEFHGIATPSYKRDVAARYLGWFDKYVKAAPQ